MKRTFLIFFCITAFALLATSCYTERRCPAYSYHLENEIEFKS